MSLSRTVNDTNSGRRRSVRPRAKYRTSLCECSASERITRGRLKKTSSHSQSVTPCFVQFFPMFPSSQSKPSTLASGSLATVSVYRSRIRSSSCERPRLRTGTPLTRLGAWSSNITSRGSHQQRNRHVQAPSVPLPARRGARGNSRGCHCFHWSCQRRCPSPLRRGEGCWAPARGRFERLPS